MVKKKQKKLLCQNLEAYYRQHFSFFELENTHLTLVSF